MPKVGRRERAVKESFFGLKYRLSFADKITMNTGMRTSMVGVLAFGRQMETVVNNTANLNTDGYKAKRATIYNDKNGLPEIRVSISPASGIPVQGPDTPVREPSDVDLSQEMTNSVTARRGYEANLKALKVQSDTEKSVLDIIV